MSELRLALRSLRRSPGFTAAAVLTLALGMGASTAVFTMLKRVVLDPLPYPASSQLVRLKNQVPGVGPGEEWQLSTAQYFYFREHARALAELGIYNADGANVAVQGEPRRANIVVSNAGLLRLLGARAVAGRLFDDTDDAPAAPAVAVLSHGFWQRGFGGDQDAMGRILRINEQPFTVIGVMAPGVELPQERGSPASPRTDVWFPMRLDPAGPFGNNHVYPTIARLAPGATAEQAEGEIARLTPELPDAFPRAYSTGFFERFGFRTVIYPLKEYVVGDMGRRLWILLGAVGLVLAIAAANVANLFLVRVEGRRREMMIRSALGAGRRAVVWNLLADSLILAAAGGALALLVSAAGVSWLAALAPPGIPRLDRVAIDAGVVGFTLALVSVVAVAVTAVSALRQRPILGLGVLAEGGRTHTVGRERHRLRSALVVAQVALALVLVVSAGLLVRSFSRLSAVDPGVDPEGVFTVQLFLPRQRYREMQDVWRFYEEVLTRVRALPGVVAAGGSEVLPFQSRYGCTVQGFEDAEVYERIRGAGMTTCAGQGVSTPGYLEALGIPLLAGRMLTREDSENPEPGAVVVSKAFADRFWPAEDPIGKGVKSADSRPPFYRVVGVVGDVHAESLDEPPALAVYYPVVPNSANWRWYLDQMYLVVRTTLADPASLFPAIRGAVREVDPEIPLANAEEMRSIVDRSLSRASFTMTLLGIAGGAALLLAAIGLYATISYIVARRTNEIGVRMALGAEPQQVQSLVVGGSLRLTLSGLGIGLVGGLALTRVLRGLLYGVAPTDPTAFLGATMVLAVVALLAGWLPARRAARVDPVVALRHE